VLPRDYPNERRSRAHHLHVETPTHQPRRDRSDETLTSLRPTKPLLCVN
jgi:hypothetical protein